jgi:hypothetical protein
MATEGIRVERPAEPVLIISILITGCVYLTVWQQTPRPSSLVLFASFDCIINDCARNINNCCYAFNASPQIWETFTSMTTPCLNGRSTPARLNQSLWPHQSRLVLLALVRISSSEWPPNDTFGNHQIRLPFLGGSLLYRQQQRTS